MNALLTLFAASALGGLDLAVLALVAKRLGAGPGGPRPALLAATVLLKLALLFAGAAWLAAQTWCVRRALVAGLMAPFALFVLWQALRLRAAGRQRA